MSDKEQIKINEFYLNKLRSDWRNLVGIYVKKLSSEISKNNISSLNLKSYLLGAIPNDKEFKSSNPLMQPYFESRFSEQSTELLNELFTQSISLRDVSFNNSVGGGIMWVAQVKSLPAYVVTLGTKDRKKADTARKSIERELNTQVIEIEAYFFSALAEEIKSLNDLSFEYSKNSGVLTLKSNSS